MSLFTQMGLLSLCLILLIGTSTASIRSIGRIKPGFSAAEMLYIDNDGLFLVSNSSDFALGFNPTKDDKTLFLLVIMHMDSQRVIWSANRGKLVGNSDKFIFDESGNVSLQKGGTLIWSPDTKGASAVELRDTGNLVLLANDNSVIWQSFSHPTDTLISKQDFVQGMKLESQSDLDSNNLTYFLEIKSGDMLLYAGYKTPQPYWSMGKENLKTINQDGGDVNRASLEVNSWNFYDQSKILLWQFTYSSDSNPNATWVAVLGSDGVINFFSLEINGPSGSKEIPNDPCSTPQSCDAYYTCSGQNKCQCPPALSGSNCQPKLNSACDDNLKSSTKFVSPGEGLSYVALEYLSPSSKTDLDGCKSSCLTNCSCVALFHHNDTKNCYLLDSIGSFEDSQQGSGFQSFVKVVGDNSESASDQKHFPYVVIIAIGTVLIIFGLIFLAYCYYKRKKNFPESPKGASSEEDNFLESLSGMPIRFTYKELQIATNDFSKKLGQGGFGSVYHGVLPDGTRLAVKQLEGIGQGKKEFRAEVSIIGSIHHLHLVRLKGFCAEGAHRLLAYELMANGSLDKWIFKKNNEFMLDWEMRFNIAVGTAKGLAYLHEDCDSKIVHCDIKPENVLLDDNFMAKVSDFGLAKLMTREQSHAFTTMRGTRGYLAPEWITSYAISEKSDVYSYGMVLLEIIGGRKNYDPSESSEKSHFPSFVFKMMEEGKLRDILDSKLTIDIEQDERACSAIKIALWCIQEDMHLRPSMAKVVQMLEGLSPVSKPPISSPLGMRLYSNVFKSMSEEGTSSGPSDCNSDAFLSAVRLSGPR